MHNLLLQHNTAATRLHYAVIQQMELPIIDKLRQQYQLSLLQLLQSNAIFQQEYQLADDIIIFTI